jgi:putative transposase
MIQQTRKRTELEDIAYYLHLYFNGLSLRYTSKAISRFVTISYTAIRDWIQKFKPERIFLSKTKISKFIVDETQIKIDSEHTWLWIAIESETKNILAISITKKRNMFVISEHFLSDVCWMNMANTRFQQ